MDQIVHEKLINPVSDRYANRVHVHRDGSEVIIHLRNLKIALLNQQQIDEWKDGFQKALEVRGERTLETYAPSSL